MNQVVLRGLAKELGFFVSPDLEQLQLRNCSRSGDRGRQPIRLVSAVVA
jgi:hypothetical protein